MKSSFILKDSNGEQFVSGFKKMLSGYTFDGHNKYDVKPIFTDNIDDALVYKKGEAVADEAVIDMVNKGFLTIQAVLVIIKQI